MWKWIGVVFVAVLIAASAYWFSIDKQVRYLIRNQPATENVLMWTTPQRDAAFQSLEILNFIPFNIVSKGDTAAALEDGKPLQLADGQMDQYFEQLRIAGLVVLHEGKLRYERYGLDFSADDKWTSFSVAKSFTSTLVGAALKDGHINSLDDKVTNYIPDMVGSAYDDVTIEQLLTMTSGVAWDEDYDDPGSDVSQFNFHTPEPGVDVTASYMRTLKRAHAPGTQWLYSTGETNLIGLLVSQATGQTLSSYLSEKIWSHIGAQQDASWLLGPTGHEISGCCIQATTRDFALFGQFILDGAVVNGEPIVPDGWFESATRTQVQFDNSDNGYGFQWWTSADGTFAGRGIFGQGIYIDPARNLVIAVNANWEVASGGPYSRKRRDMYQFISTKLDKQSL